MMMSPILRAQGGPAEQAPVSLNQILRAVRTHLGMDVGFISQFHDGRRIFRHVESAEGRACIEVGGSDALEDSYCYWINQGELPRLIRDARDHPFAKRFPATEALPVGGHLSVPIRLRDGSIYGTFCCFSFAPDRSLTERDLATMAAFAQVAAEQIQQGMDEQQARDGKTARIRRLLRDRAVRMVFQPAIRTGTQRIVFVEALARFAAKPYQTPDLWFAAAGEVGLRAELELMAIEAALDGVAKLPDTVSLSFNASPDTILHAEFGSALQAAPLKRVIVEITEHEAVARYSSLVEALAPLRGRGLRVAVDDVGAGYSSLCHILRLRPDILKLDMALSRGIDGDPARRALAGALVSFCHETGSELVAEGVETEAELRALQALGVDVVQGFLFGKPAPLDQTSQSGATVAAQTPLDLSRGWT